jgi:FkbM family methyltransferase
MLVPRLLTRLAASGPAGPVRAAVNRVGGGRLRVVRVRSGIARGCRLEVDLAGEKAYWLGHHEPVLQEFLRANVRPGAVVYDVGSHHGFLGICAARLGATVFAFEPSAENAARIRRNAELNALPIEVVEAAVWDAASGVALVPGSSDSEWQSVPGGRVTSLTLDEFAATHPPPDLVKIDVEGAEARVLRGAQGLLRSRRPVVVCELHGSVSEDAVPELLPGYRLERLGDPARIAAFPED